MHILNLTPHVVNFLKEECTVQQRSGKILLRPDVTLEDALIASIKPESKPLTITPDGGIDLTCDNIRCYASISKAQDNYGFSTSLLNSNPGSCSYWFDYQFEQADILIVSQRCANYINAKIPQIQFGSQGETRRINLLDKFYMPFNVVYPNRIAGSLSQSADGHKPLGALGVQKVCGYFDLSFYVAAIRESLTVSIPGLCIAAMNYINRADRSNFDAIYGGIPECNLRTANNYLVQRGYQPYPELYPR